MSGITQMLLGGAFTANPATTQLLLRLASDVNDASANGITMTNSGMTQVSVTDPFGGSTCYQFVTGCSIYSNTNSALALGTQDFSIEWWEKSRTQNDKVAIGCVGGGGASPMIGYSGGGNGSRQQLYFGTAANNYDLCINVDFGNSSSSWVHMCVTRTGTTFRTFNNGVLAGVATGKSGSIYQNSNAWKINHEGYSCGDGYISCFRLVTGGIPTPYQTSSETVGATIFTVPASALTTSVY